MTITHFSIDTSSDGHVHTKLCNHATGEMEEYVLSAIDRGLREMYFLEHLEAGVNYAPRTWLTEADFAYYCEEGERLRRKYADRISVNIGIELGYNSSHSKELLTGARAKPWDRIGLSCHFLQIPGSNKHINLLSRKQENIDRAREYGLGTLLSLYYDTLLEAVENIPADVLCHLDAPLRYSGPIQLTDYHLEQIDRLLAAVKAKGMAMEINTSGIPIRKEPFPAKALVKMALDHGIQLVAGSDSHKPEDIGRHFDELEIYIAEVKAL
ncbi:histidinol-phosphatase [Desulfosediminicola sp.]|uniref:histidinol-phosphatase n=1 Tax=Desulfosediminicola sp. TaxID=2886825 RepID=UPI003AF2AF9D